MHLKTLTIEIKKKYIRAGYLKYLLTIYNVRLIIVYFLEAK